MRLTFSLIMITAVVFALQNFFPWITVSFSLVPAHALNGAWWQFLTYIFLHAGNLHFILNMIVFGIFGPAVEDSLGWKKFLSLYFVSGFGSALLHIALTGDSLVSMLGASGAIFGVLTAYGFLFPKNWIMVFFIPLPATIAIIAIAAFEVVSGVLGLFPGIANFGHLGGIVTGFLLMAAWRLLEKKVPLEERKERTYEFLWE